MMLGPQRNPSEASMVKKITPSRDIPAPIATRAHGEYVFRSPDLPSRTNMLCAYEAL